VTGALSVQNLSARHGRSDVLREVSLELPGQALACVLGPSGCGKTTLLRAIAGFHRPISGRIELNGRLLEDSRGIHVPPERRRVGYIPQDGALFPHLSVAANVGFAVPRRDRAARVDQLLSLTALEGLGARYPHELSGGQQQRVAIARALAPSPDFLLLDEPFSALDAQLRARVRSEVVDLLRRAGTPAILVTHDGAEALAFADVIAVMDSGRIRQIGTSEALYEQPANAQVATALGEANIVAARFDGMHAITALGRIPLSSPAAPGSAEVVIRPQQLMTGGPADGRPADRTSGDEASVSAEVVRDGYLGGQHRLELLVDPQAARLVGYSAIGYTTGARIRLRVEGAVHPLRPEPS
jgi:iron(III) transport system ATP-binding protein